MNTYRRIELIAGLGAGLLGLLGLAYTLFGPTYGYQEATLNSDGTTSMRSGTASLIEMHPLQPITIVVVVVLALLVAGVAIGGYLHSRRGSNTGRWLLGVSTGLLGFMVVITGWGFGPTLLPCWSFALIAAMMADRVNRQQGAADHDRMKAS
jgi:hypothetical protein